jgi:hypothetical protein
VPTFFDFRRTAISIQDRIGNFVRHAALGGLKEVRAHLKRDCRIGVADAMLNL